MCVCLRSFDVKLTLRVIIVYFFFLEDDSDEKDPDEKIEQDPYFRLSDPDNEHERFKDAEDRLEKKHREKVAKVLSFECCFNKLKHLI